MGYRGEDLDLRTPQQANASPPEPALSPDTLLNGPRGRMQAPAGRASPIWVDDLILECCNHAYEVALAHRAAEVRLEHLIYALTRLDPAAEILEAHGIRVAALRRDAAFVISTEIPATSGKSAPRRAEALEETLRLAASIAYRRQSAVTVEDLLAVLLDPSHDLPALQRVRPLFQRTPAAPILDQIPAEFTRDRLRAQFYATEPQRGLSSELASLASAQQTYSQASRIDLLEQSIRTLSNEIANERKVVSGVLHDLQREVMAHREDTTRQSGISQDKLQLFLGERIQGLEQALMNARSYASGDLSLLNDKLATIERSLGAELAAARTSIAELAAKPVPVVDIAPLTHRIDVIEEAVLSRETAERIQALETAVAAERERATIAQEQLRTDLLGLTSLLERHPGEVAAMITGPLNDRVNGLAISVDNHHATTSDGITDAQRRLVALDETLQSHIGRTENAESVAAQEFGALHDEVAKMTASSTQSFVELRDALGKINTNQHTLAATLATQGRDAAQAITALATRIDALESSLAKPVSMLETLSGTVDKMHRLMVEKYFRRNRFWYWLFGTDDWLAASWPSQTTRIAEELDLVRRK